MNQSDLPPPNVTTNVTSDSTWKQLAIALGRKLMTLSYGFENQIVKDEALLEAIYLTDQVWLKQKAEQTEEAESPEFEKALNDFTADAEDEATEFILDNSKEDINTTDMDRKEVLKTALKLGWEQYPEPTDAEITNYGEPPISLAEMHTNATHQKRTETHPHRYSYASR